MGFKVEGDARVAFTNVPGAVPSAPDNGEIKVHQADGYLVTRRANGTMRKTPLDLGAAAMLSLEEIGRLAPKGDTGPRGPQGPAGVAGSAGLQGAQGVQGIQGIDGPTGPQGPTGGTGPQGPVGPQGAGVSIKGTRATPGDLPASGALGDTYVISTTNASASPPYTAGDGFSYTGGTSGVGPGGAYTNVGQIRGPTGPQGATGSTGSVGPAGQTGPQGAAGQAGAAGPQGPQGPKGETGPAPDTSTFARLTGADFGGTITAPLLSNKAGSLGYVRMETASSDRTGLLSFYPPSGGARHGYIGHGDGNSINLVSEVGRFNFVGSIAPTINALPIWYGGNFNPADQSPTRLRFGGAQVLLEDIYDSYSGAGRLGVRRPAENNYAFADIHMSRDTRQTVGPGAGVSTMLRMDAAIGPNNAHLYALLTSMMLTKAKAGETRAGGTGSGHHVAQYSQLWTEFDTPVWTYCTELRCRFPNPTTPSIGIELGWYGDGGDPNNCRIGLDVSYGAATVYNTGDNVQSVGVRVAPYFGQSDWDQSNYNPETGQSANVGRAILKYGLQISGNVGTGIDLTGMKVAYSDTAVLMSDNSRLKWTNGGALGFFGNSLVIQPPASGIITGSAFTYADGYIKGFIPSIGNVKIPYALL